MRFSKISVLGALTTSLLVVGLSLLSTSAYAEEERDDADAVARGARAWADNCARCHNLRDPKEFPDHLWRPIVTHMRVRAGLTGEEERAILKFLQETN